jgi:hypothetical protein
VVHVRNPGGPVSLRLEQSLARAGLEDGAVLRLSLMADEQGQPEDVAPFLQETLDRVYSGRDRQRRHDAARILAGGSQAPRQGTPPPASAGSPGAVEREHLPDLVLLAAASAAEDAGMKAALGRLALYGPPEEVAQEAWIYLRPSQQRELERLWHGSARRQRGTSITLKPVSGS